MPPAYASLAYLSFFFDARHLGAAHQPGYAAQVVEADPQAVEHAVLGRAAGARAVADRHALAGKAGALDQGRQVAVHVVEVGQAQEGFALDQFQAATGVGRVVLEHARTHRVGDLRTDALVETVLAGGAPAGKQAHVGSGLVARRQQLGNVRRIVLAVAVERGHPRRFGGAHAVPYSRALAAARGVVQHAQFRV